MPDTKSQARSDRLKAALRENLKRRKVQARGREAADEPDSGETGKPPRSDKNRAE